MSKPYFHRLLYLYLVDIHRCNFHRATLQSFGSCATHRKPYSLCMMGASCGIHCYNIGLIMLRHVEYSFVIFPLTYPLCLPAAKITYAINSWSVRIFYVSVKNTLLSCFCLVASADEFNCQHQGSWIY